MTILLRPNKDYWWR